MRQTYVFKLVSVCCWDAVKITNHDMANSHVHECIIQYSRCWWWCRHKNYFPWQKHTDMFDQVASWSLFLDTGLLGTMSGNRMFMEKIRNICYFTVVTFFNDFIRRAPADTPSTLRVWLRPCADSEQKWLCAREQRVATLSLQAGERPCQRVNTHL